MGWDRKKDRDLLDLMKDKFDVLITIDKKLASQNPIVSRTFGVITLRAKTNRIQDLLQLLPELKSALRRVKPGSVIEIG